MQTDLSSPPATTTATRWHLLDRVAFYLLATVITGFLAASAAPTPLYATYARLWGFSSITTTVVFGIYAGAVLFSLLVFGKLSDHIGRRPVLLAALLLQAVSTLVFATADGVPSLLLARVLQGLATGAASGAIGAALLDLDEARGTIGNAIAAPLGTGVGALLAGVTVQFLPAPTHLVYLLLLGVFAVQTVGVLLMRETVTRAPGALRSMLPEFAMPAQARTALLVATPALVACWALTGFYASLGPALMHALAGSQSQLLGGVPLAIIAIGGAFMVFLSRNGDPVQVMRLGCAGLIAGVGLTLVAVAIDSTAGYLVATLVAGLGFGGAFQGAIRTVVPLAHAHERAGLLSLVYVVSYTALGVPAILGGLLAVHNADVLGTSREYGIGVVVLAVLASLGLLRRRTSSPAGCGATG